MSTTTNLEKLDFKTFLNEGKISNLLKKTKNNISSFVKKVISSIGFGQTKKIQLSAMNEKVSQGMQAQLGYYSEYVTAQEIIKLLKENNISVSLNNSSSSPYKAISKKVTDYRTRILELDPELTPDVKSQEQQGQKMGQSIYSDAINNGEDIILLHFNVILTGDSLKGENKADVVVEITKQDTKEVVDNIMASLKSYKKWAINLANNTLVSFFNNIGVKLDKQVLSEMKRLSNVRANIWKFYKKDDFASVKKLYGTKVAMSVKPLFKTKFEPRPKNKATDAEKVIIKAGHDVMQREISNYFVNILRTEYKKNKTEINKRILILLGFDGSDDFYLAVKEKEKISVLSNRTSPMYNSMIEKMQSKFNMVIRYNEKSPSVIYMDFYDVNKKKILNSKITVGQTSSTGSSRTNWWADFKSFQSDAR